MMKTILTCVILSAFAVPVHAGHGSIEETDDGYIVEYSGDSAEKPAQDNVSGPTVEPGTNPVSPEGPAMRVENTTPDSTRPERARGRNRMNNASRVGRPEETE